MQLAKFKGKTEIEYRLQTQYTSGFYSNVISKLNLQYYCCIDWFD